MWYVICLMIGAILGFLVRYWLRSLVFFQVFSLVKDSVIRSVVEKRGQSLRHLYSANPSAPQG